MVTPEAPWCPAAWQAHLEAVAPGLAVPHVTPDTAEASGAHVRHDGWQLLLGARRGKLHAHRGDHREDAGQIVTFSNGWCVAVADGAGSASWSRLGASIATHVVTQALRELLLHGRAPVSMLAPALRTAAQQTHDAMRDFVSRTDTAPRDHRTTLLVAARLGDQVGLMQVGDGAIAWLHADGRASQPLAGHAGDFSGEVSHFLPDDGAVQELIASIVVTDASDCAALLVASDGIEDPWYPFAKHAVPLYAQMVRGVSPDVPTPAGVTPVFHQAVLSAADPVHALTEWLAFEKRGENDDRTLCIVRQEALSWGA